MKFSSNSDYFLTKNVSDAGNDDGPECMFIATGGKLNNTVRTDAKKVITICHILCFRSLRSKDHLAERDAYMFKANHDACILCCVIHF